jgi:hypothetical protein
MSQGIVRRLAAGLLALGLLAACTTAQQVRWESYSAQVQARIDAARAAKDCATLKALLANAIASSGAHEKATGVPNDALEQYIRNALEAAGCPTS